MESHGGMTLERYADVSAIVSDVIDDPAACNAKLQAEGIRPEDWEAAKSGWTQKMQSMSDFGQTATKYMQLYQAALNRRGGTTQVSYDDYISMRALASARGLDQMLAAYGVSQAQWTQIAGHWNNEIGNNMIQYAGVNARIGAEEVRLRGGGEPKPISIQKAAPNPTAPAAAPQPAAGAAFGFGGIANSIGNMFGGGQQQQPQQAAPQQPAQQAPPAPAPAGGGFGLGETVLVQWNDGNKYPARVKQAQGGKYLVGFDDGRELWVDPPWLSRG